MKGSKQLKRILAVLLTASMTLPMSAVSALAAEPAEKGQEIETASYTNGTLLSAGPHVTQTNNTSVDQPFPANAGESQKFRIPAIITLHNGWLMAAADARYATTADGGGLDTILSISKDDGKNWENSLPLYFPDSNGYVGPTATTIIDPILIQGADDTIYLMADVNPTGNTTMYKVPGVGTGYADVDGTQRLVLTEVYANTTKTPTKDDLTSYPYYVGDLKDGYAPVMKRADKTATQWVVDECYNIYEQKNGTITPLTQKQVNTNSTTDIQQNVFYQGSALHVYQTGYMWLATSKDNGATWSHKILNPEIKRDNEKILLVSPGRGLVCEDGTVIIGFYKRDTVNESGTVIDGTERATFIFSKDNGATWKRIGDIPGTTSSENEMVELADGTIRMFVRSNSGVNKIVYKDAVWNEAAQTYEWQEGGIVQTDVACWSGCNCTAIKYSQKIDGKDAILVSYPGGPSGRLNGRIWVFLVEEDNSMNLAYTYEVNKIGYAYSCLTELENGMVGLLYENRGGDGTLDYDSYDIRDVAKGAVIGERRELEVPLYGTYTETIFGEFNPEWMPAEDILEVKIEKAGDGKTTVSYTGKAIGTVTFKDTVSNVRYVVNVTGSSAEKIYLNEGEKKRIGIAQAAEITHQPDSAVVTAELVENTGDINWQTSTAFHGSDANYDGEQVALSKALYTLAAGGTDGTFTASATADNGQAVYLCPRAGGAGYPSTTKSDDLTFTSNEDGTFDIQAKTYGGYLYFHRNAQCRFDQQSTKADATKFLIYAPAEGNGAGSKEVPGYVQVTKASDLKVGGKYLIIAEYDGSHYALYPSSSTSDVYAHVVKVNADNSALEITAVKTGVTDIMLSNGNLYRVYVGNTQDVTLDAGEGRLKEKTVKLTQGVEVDYLPEATRKGYVFEGWYDASGKEVKVGDVYDSTGVLTAKWGDEPAEDDFETLRSRMDKYERRMNEDAFKEHYTEESWNAYLEELNKADSLFTDTKVSKQRMEEEYNNLLAAHKALEPKVSADAFTDVKEAWMVENVANAYQQKLMTGKTADTFAPVMPINRAEVAVVIHRMAGSPKEEKTATFTDLTQGWYKEAVNWASAAKTDDMPKAIVTGYSETEFRPGNPISRQEIAMMLYRYAAYMGYDTSTEEDPNATVHWAELYDENDKPWGGDAETALRWCVAKGLITGNTKNGKATLDPFGTAYRVQAAAIFSRFADKFEN